MEFLLLGPLEVRSDRGSVPLGGPRQRAVLADLLLHAGTVVAKDRLVDDLWGEHPPPTADSVVQNAVSRLRRVLPPGTIETRAPGYVACVDPGAIDLLRFERLVGGARALPPAERSATLHNALALWRGPVLEDLESVGFVEEARHHLGETRLVALEDRLEAELELGHHDAVVPELESLAGAYPTRERLRRLQMLALYRAGRDQEALDVFEATRRQLDEAFGLEPSETLTALQLMILRRDPALSGPGPSVARAGQVLRRVAVLFVRVHFDTAPALELEVRRISHAGETLRAVSSRHGGELLPMSGGDLVAVFGAGDAWEDDVARAGRAAIEVRAILGDRGLAARFAVSAERIVLDDGRPVIVGSTLNGARQVIEQLDAGEIGLSAEAAASARPDFELDGRGGPCRLLGVRSRLHRTTRLPMVGRDDELAWLRSLLTDVATSGAPRHVVVVGEPGIGKTRVVEELAQTAAVTVLWTVCPPYGQDTTYQPLRELVTAAREVDGSLQPAGDLSTEQSALDLARTTVEVLARSRPLLVVVDDAHWAGPSMLDLLEYVVRAATGAVLVITIGRPELLEERPTWVERTRSLERLGPEEMGAMLEALPGAVQLDAPGRALVLETADGVPLYVEQLVALAIESELAEIAMPPSLDALLASRVERLHPGERETLGRASVIGTTFELDALASLAGGAELGPRIDTLERLRFVRRWANGRECEFTHGLMREAVYATLPKHERARLHELTARHFAQERRHVTAAYHFESAALLAREVGERDVSLELEAAERLVDAGLDARRSGDVTAAIDLLRRADDLLPTDDRRRPELLVERALALRAATRHDEASASLDSARVAANRLRSKRMLHRIEVESIIPRVMRDGDLGSADETIARAIPVFRRAGDNASLGRAFLVAAFLASNRCAFAEAERFAEEADVSLRRWGGSAERAMLLLASSAFHGLRPVSALRARLEELTARTGGDAVVEAHITAFRAWTEALAGETELARRLAAESRAVFVEHGQELAVVASHPALYGEIELLARDGDLAGAEADLRDAIHSLTQGGERALAARHEVLLAEIVHRRGATGDALRLVRRGARALPSVDVYEHVNARRVEGLAVAASGDVRRGERLVRNALGRLVGTDALELRARVLASVAEVALLANDRERLAQALLEAAEGAAAKGCVAADRRIAELLAATRQVHAPVTEATGASGA